ncbi:hypothetical protein HJC23_013269 [Cyclotella cryptica]|uniref:Uncharacterized protein n=1 Tax=Cyclotella cryptica TaxID=29204 RepID=A0ABD3PGU4_9STRA|eukprot:CCRYP_014931-RA/>CCRYP_014931-RA protein AED:0.21 eAED:0.21 QI:0/-1/0/1/-1/1/1/0/214
MGRYTTVQAYADNSGSMRAVSYDQATGSATAAKPAERGPVVTEKVDNPYGSTAGAGSGEFHVYRHARAREMARWKEINANEAEMKAEEEFQKKIAADARAEQEKTEKRRRKREREKNAKKRKKNLKLGGVALDVHQEDDEGNDTDEFEYTPVASLEMKPTSGVVKSEDDVTDNCDHRKMEDSTHSRPKGDASSPVEFPSDGSFPERMKKQLASA